MNGVCYVNGTLPFCKCFADFTGENCEAEQVYLRVVRYVKISTSLIAVIFLGLTGLIFVLSDVWNFYTKTSEDKRNPQVTKRTQKELLRQFKYVTWKQSLERSEREAI